MTTRTKPALTFYVTDHDTSNVYGPFHNRHEATAFAHDLLGAHFTITGSDPSRPLTTKGRAGR